MSQFLLGAAYQGRAAYLGMKGAAAAEPRERQLSSLELPWLLHLFPLLIKLISVSLMRRCSGFLLWMEREREMETTERMTERKNTTRPFVG